MRFSFTPNLIWKKSDFFIPFLDVSGFLFVKKWKKISLKNIFRYFFRLFFSNSCRREASPYHIWNKVFSSPLFSALRIRSDSLPHFLESRLLRFFEDFLFPFPQCSQKSQNILKYPKSKISKIQKKIRKNPIKDYWFLADYSVLPENCLKKTSSYWNYRI